MATISPCCMCTGCGMSRPYQGQNYFATWVSFLYYIIDLSSRLFYSSLKSCNLTVTCCEILANCIGSSRITELDLSNNNLTDLGIIRLSAGLKKIKLETLRSKPDMFLSFFSPRFFMCERVVLDFLFILCSFRLGSCSLTDQCCNDLASFLSTASCQLKVLDLSDNDFQDTGISVLAGGLGSPHCKLEILMWVP